MWSFKSFFTTQFLQLSYQNCSDSWDVRKIQSYEWSDILVFLQDTEKWPISLFRNLTWAGVRKVAKWCKQIIQKFRHFNQHFLSRRSWKLEKCEKCRIYITGPLALFAEMEPVKKNLTLKAISYRRRFYSAAIVRFLLPPCSVVASGKNTFRYCSLLGGANNKLTVCLFVL